MGNSQKKEETHIIGNRQGNGYGRFILGAIEEDARYSGVAGLAAWGMDFPCEAAEGLDDIATYSEVDTSRREALERRGISAGVYLEGEAYRPYEPPANASVLREDILKMLDKKRGTHTG